MLQSSESLDEIEWTTPWNVVQAQVTAYRKIAWSDGFFEETLRIQGNAQALWNLAKVMENFELDWKITGADYIGDCSFCFSSLCACNGLEQRIHNQYQNTTGHHLQPTVQLCQQIEFESSRRWTRTFRT